MTENVHAETVTQAQMKLLHEDVRNGDINAMVALAKLLEAGTHGTPDIESAVALYEKAAANGNAYALNSLGLIRAKNSEKDALEKAVEYFKKAAELDHHTALFNLGCLYDEANCIADKDKAKLYYERAMEKGNSDAAYNLALMYMDGDFGAPNFEKALKLLLAPANNGDADSCYSLGVLYQGKHLGKPNNKLSQKYFSIAAKLGHNAAMGQLTNPMIGEVLEILERDNVDQSIRIKIKNALTKLESTFFDIRTEHLVSGKVKLSHFTTWETLEKILANGPNKVTENNRLRQYHVDYMNDPSEGGRLLNFKSAGNEENFSDGTITSLKLKNLFQQHYYNVFLEHNATSQILPSIFTVSLTEDSDRLDLWRAYGRDGIGYSIALQMDITKDDVPLKRMNRQASHAFMKAPGYAEVDTAATHDLPTFYRIFYDDQAVANTLSKLSQPLERLYSLEEKVSHSHWNKIASCSTAILLELLYLYKDEQYSTEREARALAVMPLDDPRIRIDERTPGHLYCETSAFLFRTAGSEIILGPKVPNTAAAIWNLRHKLTALGLASNTVVKKSCVPYR